METQVIDLNGTKIYTTKDYTIPKIAKFEKISFSQFKNDILNLMGDIFKDKEDIIKTLYNDIKLPKRATKDSAGYDFFTPISFVPKTNNGITIPTGIRCHIKEGWTLKLYPRSGHGFKYGIYLYDTTGIIDGDYYYSDNEGHILVKIAAKEQCDIIKAGTAFCQGVFTPYGIIEDDDVIGIRNGGFGSTSKE